MSSLTQVQVDFLARCRVARLATVSADGEPHVIPICYVFDGERILSPLDEKPKRVAASRLQRVRNIRANSRAALVVDDYSEDWRELGYLLIHATAEIIEDGPVHERAVGLLREKYPQYREMAIGERPMLALTPTRAVAWGTAAPTA